MSKQTEKLESFLTDESNFISKLRFLDGLDKNSVQTFLTLLDDIGNEIKDKEVIEKKLVFLLIEVVPTLMSIETTYSGKEHEEIVNVIAQISMKIGEILEP